MYIVNDETRAKANVLVQRLDEKRKSEEFSTIREYVSCLVHKWYGKGGFSIRKLDSPESARRDYRKVLDIYESGLATIVVNDFGSGYCPIKEISVEDYRLLVQLVKLPDFKERLIAWIKAIYGAGEYPEANIYLGKVHALVRWYHFIETLLEYHTNHGLDLAYESLLSNRSLLYKRKKLPKWRKALNRDYSVIVDSILAIEQFEISGNTINIFYQLYETYVLLDRMLGDESSRIVKVKRAVN